MLLRTFTAVLALVVSSGCAHSRVSASALDRTSRPAFIARVQEDAGPRAEVFREDSTYKPRLKQLSRAEADRRLASKLTKGMTRFEVAERLRATTFALLPRQAPWTNTVPPASVAKVLESFLVHEVPANAPDYNLLKSLGADAVVEFVIEKYGMRSEDGKSGAFLEGYGRMFFIDGGEVWKRSFTIDSLDAGSPGVDPFAVAKKPEMFREQLGPLIDAAAQQFAKDLSPEGRQGAAPPPEGSGELTDEGDTTAPTAAPREEAPSPSEEDPL